MSVSDEIEVRYVEIARLKQKIALLQEEIAALRGASTSRLVQDEWDNGNYGQGDL